MIMLDFDAFVDKYYPTANEQKVNDVRRFLAHASELAGDSDLKDKLSDDNFLCGTFYLQKLNAITRTHYQKIKEYLLNLFDWYKIDGKVPSHATVIGFTQVYTYFRDLDSALLFIDKVGEARLENYNPRQDLVTVKSIFILGWYGLSLKEISSLKKNDVAKTENGTGVIRVGNKKIRVDSRSIDVLMNLKYIESYQSLPGGRIKYFKGREDYMFRSPNSACESVEETHITQTIKRFNANVPCYMNQNIAFRSIYRNAKFVDVYNDASNDSLLQKLEKHTACSSKQTFSYRTQYLAWVELINEGKI